jgi:Zn finger protein HypA/HybF involved in hydrogenase expression
MSTRVRIASIELIVHCPHCGDAVPINTLERKSVCDNCQEEFPLSEDFWKRVFTGVDDDWHEIAEQQKRQWTMGLGSGPKVVYGPDAARCEKCKEPLPVDSFPFGSEGAIKCASCGAEALTYGVPAWLAQLVPTARQIYGGEPPPVAVAGAGSTASAQVDQAAVRPVVMQCPQCGGSLKVTAGSDRTIPCEFCGVDVYLPDGLWKRLHPVKTKRTWYIAFQGKTAKQISEEREREQRLAEQDRRIQEAAMEEPSAAASIKGSSSAWSWIAIIGAALGIPGLVFGIRACNKKKMDERLSKHARTVQPRVPDTDPKLSGSIEVRHPELGQWSMEPTLCWSGQRQGYYGVQLGSKTTPCWLYISRAGARSGKLVVELQKKGSGSKLYKLRGCEKLEGSLHRSGNIRVNRIHPMRGELRIDCDIKDEKGKKRGSVSGEVSFSMCH